MSLSYTELLARPYPYHTSDYQGGLQGAALELFPPPTTNVCSRGGTVPVPRPVSYRWYG